MTEGSRIINMDKLKQYINDLTLHASRCGGSVVLSGETRYGLASIITLKCSECGHTVTLETSPKVKGPSKHTRWECNLAADDYWGWVQSSRREHECVGSPRDDQSQLCQH